MTPILPDFIIIGAMKAGTTTLYEMLSHHPAIGMSREKETDFFIATRNWQRGLGWYHGQFTPGHAIQGEASIIRPQARGAASMRSTWRAIRTVSRFTHEPACI